MDRRPAILIVDDEYSVRDSLEHWLRKDGYTVRSAASAAEALEALEASRFEVAIVDVRMPGMDGLQLQERMQAIDADMAVIMITAFVGQAILLEASLSYLGLGVQEPTPAWGLMLQGGAEEYALSAPWMAIFPGLAITLAVFGFNLFGDAVRDVLDAGYRTADIMQEGKTLISCTDMGSAVVEAMGKRAA